MDVLIVVFAISESLSVFLFMVGSGVPVLLLEDRSGILRLLLKSSSLTALGSLRIMVVCFAIFFVLFFFLRSDFSLRSLAFLNSSFEFEFSPFFSFSFNRVSVYPMPLSRDLSFLASFVNY